MQMATPVVRKILALPLDLAEEVRLFRERESVPSETEAIRRLIWSGLRAEAGVTVQPNLDVRGPKERAGGGRKRRGKAGS